MSIKTTTTTQAFSHLVQRVFFPPNHTTVKLFEMQPSEINYLILKSLLKSYSHSLK
jgi:hypothetical protein